MVDRNARRLSWVVVSLMVVTLAACSVLRLAYNQAHHYVSWRMDRAFDLDDAQKQLAKRGISEFFTWHRSAQLPLYVTFTEKAQQDAKGQITPALACERRKEMEGWMKATIEHGVAPMSRVLATLRPEQLAHLQKHYDDKNEEFEDEYLDDDADDRRKAADKFAVKWLERFYGRIDSGQRKQISADMARLPFHAEDLNKERLRFQQRFMALLKQAQAEKMSAAQLQGPLRALLLDLIEPTEPARKAQLDRWNTAGCQMAANVHNRITPSQRETLTERLQGWHKDLVELSRPSPSR